MIVLILIFNSISYIGLTDLTKNIKKKTCLGYFERLILKVLIFSLPNIYSRPLNQNLLHFNLLVAVNPRWCNPFITGSSAYLWVVPHFLPQMYLTLCSNVQDSFSCLPMPD